MNYFVLKRRHTDTYYTIRNAKNVPAIVAFTRARPAKTMLKTILNFEEHKQPIVVEKVPADFLMKTCSATIQPVVVYDQGYTMELDVGVHHISTHDARFHLENKYMYH